MPDIPGKVASGFLTEVDARLPGRLEGLYLVGSSAYDDFHAHTSDVDFVAVTGDRLTATELGSVEEAHRALSGTWKPPRLEGIYATWEDLAADPLAGGPYPHYDGSGLHPPGMPHNANPVQWRTLGTAPAVVRGPIPDVWFDESALRSWTLLNVDHYWTRWVQRQRRLSRTAAMTMTDWGVAWGVLGLPRMHLTISTDDVTSKTGSGRYALETFDGRWHQIVREALRIRTRSHKRSLYRLRLRRRAETLAFMTHVIDECKAAAAQSRT